MSSQEVGGKCNPCLENGAEIQANRKKGILLRSRKAEINGHNHCKLATTNKALCAGEHVDAGENFLGKKEGEKKNTSNYVICAINHSVLCS